MYETQLKLAEAVTSHLSTNSMKTYSISAVNIIVNKFVTQIVSNTERTKCGISLSSMRSAAIKYKGEVRGFM